MKNFLVGKRIYLRGLIDREVQEDTAYFKWLNDLSLDQFTNRSDFPHSIEGLRKYIERSRTTHDIVHLGIFDKSSDRHIGNISLQEFDWVNRRAFIGYLLGDHEFSGKGLATEAVLMMMYYGFNRLNLERIHTTISEKNIGSLKVAEKTGLITEGRMRKHLLRNGQWSDLLVVGALKSEWMRGFGSKAGSLFETSPA